MWNKTKTVREREMGYQLAKNKDTAGCREQRWTHWATANKDPSGCVGKPASPPQSRAVICRGSSEATGFGPEDWRVEEDGAAGKEWAGRLPSRSAAPIVPLPRPGHRGIWARRGTSVEGPNDGGRWRRPCSSPGLTWAYPDQGRSITFSSTVVK